MKPAYQTVIFDIDGTLLKSDRGVMNALKYTTEKMGVPYPSAETGLIPARKAAFYPLRAAAGPSVTIP